MGARNQVGIGIPYRPARLHRLTESIPWNRFLGSLKYHLGFQILGTISAGIGNVVIVFPNFYEVNGLCRRGGYKEMSSIS